MCLQCLKFPSKIMVLIKISRMNYYTEIHLFILPDWGGEWSGGCTLGLFQAPVHVQEWLLLVPGI